MQAIDMRSVMGKKERIHRTRGEEKSLSASTRGEGGLRPVPKRERMRAGEGSGSRSMAGTKNKAGIENRQCR